MTDRASFFRDDLRAYIEFRKDCYGEMLTPESVDFEDFMAFLDIEHYLGLRGSDTWSRDGNEAQVVVKTLIGEILTERTPPKEKLPNLYLEFAKTLRPHDIVLTFNYDVVLERALEAVGVPFRLFPDRFKAVHPGSHAEVDSSIEEVILLKLHGSVDWFDRSNYSHLEEAFHRSGSTHRPYHPAFNPNKKLALTPLVEGPRFPDDPLREMYRVRDIEQFYASRPLFQATPWLLNPSSAKILYSRTLREFWYGLGSAGILNFGVAVIGFSLSPQDAYARQVLYRLITNYQREYWNEDVLGTGMRKRPLLLVDLCKSDQAKERFRQRYSFVDWSRAEVYFDGFDDRAVNFLRAD